MPAWITLQPTDVNDYLVGALGNAASGKALAPGQLPTTQRVINAVVKQVRDEVATFSENRLSLTATAIPPGLQVYALEIVAEKLVVRIAIALDESQLKQINRAADNARSALMRVAAGKLKVELPDDPIPDSVATVPQSGGIEVASAPRRNATREGLSHL